MKKSVIVLALTVATALLIMAGTGGNSNSAPAESANPGTLAVGAGHWSDAHTIGPHSSRGPTPNGWVKPNIMGADCGEPASQPLSEQNFGFCGTSHHFDDGRLPVRQRFPGYSPVQAAGYLKDHAERRGTVPNNSWGYGFAQLPPHDAMAPAPTQASPVGVWVSTDTDNAGSATRLPVRLMTGDEGALAENDELTVMLPTSSVPASTEEDVVNNGAGPRSVATDMTSGRSILTPGAGIPENRNVSVVFSEAAGITNPDRAGAASVSTTAEGAPAGARVTVTDAAAMMRAIDVAPPVPGVDSRITLKFVAPENLSSIQDSEVIFRFHKDFSVTGGRVDVSRVTIQANSISGGPEVDTPKASGVVNPTSATVTYETVDRQPQVRLAVPDMADDEGDQHILQGAVVTVVFQQGSGIINPTEAESYGIEYGVNSDANLSSLGAAILPVFVGLSSHGGRRSTLVAAVAKGVEGGEGVLFWLDTATAAVPPSRVVDGPDGVYDQDSEAVLCLTDADSNDTATCVFEVQNPPFFPGKLLWVNVQDSEGRRVGPLSLTVDQTDGSVSAVIRSAPSTPYDWTSITGAGYTLARHPISHAFVKLDARVAIQPSEVNIGDTVTVTMYDYAAGPLSEIKIGSVVLDLSDPELDIRTQPGQGPGHRSFTFVIPAAVDGAPIPLGKVRVDVAVAPAAAGDRTADTSITIAGASSDQCGETLTGDGSVSGQWAQGCDSQTSGRGHARYYSFTLAQRGEVTITLESDDADTYLYLRAGAARSGDFLYENDDHEGSTRKSLIAQTLAAGVYTIEATTYSEGETGSFTLTVAGLGTIGTAPPGPDRAALVALYNATNGPNWVNKANWLSDEPLGEWYGVTTDGGGRVARLNLDNNQLIGGIPPELGSLSNLQWLEFGNDGFSCGAQGCDPTSPSANWLSGGMPAELGNLVNLWLLNLRGNQLSGEIPSELGALGNLRWLHLDGNRLSGEIPTELAQLANLTGIVLSFNQLNGEIPSELGNLANLQWLALSDNQLSGEIPSELGNLANLTGMLLSGNQLSGEIPAELGSLDGLEKVHLFNNRLSGEIPSALGDLTNLRLLALSGNQLSGEIPSELGDLASLEWLDLSANQLSGEIPSALGDLANLESLHLDGNQFSEEIPSELGNLANLRLLELSDNQLSGEIPAELGNLANLWLLNLRGNQLSGEIPAELGNLANLESLRLPGNQLSGEIPSELGNLAGLRSLDLRANQLSGEIPPELGDLASLGWLDLSANQLSGEIPAELGQLANLTELSLYNNQLSGEIPAELGRLANLRLLWLRGNQLSGCIPEGLRDVENNDLDRLRLPFCGDTPGLTPTDPCGQTLSGDGMVSGQWAAGCDSQTRDGRHARYYSFTLAQQSEVTITLESDDADTYLYLRAGEARSGGYLYQNDDSPDTTRSQIQETLAAGIYTVEATTYAAGGTGRFTLTLSGLGTTAPTPGPEPADECGQTLSGDGSVSGEWAEGCDSQVAERGHARYYTFILNAESAVTITLESQDADTYLYLRAGEVRSGDFLHQNDDHQGDTSISQIREALVAGTYTIEATTFNPGETGGFTLTVAGLGATGPAPQGSDRAALIALYNATDGPNWVSKTNWLSDEPLGEWYGVTTDGGGRVTRLDLNTNQLIGEIPPELGSLSNLQRLNLSNNAISCGQQGCEPRSPSANRLSGEMPTELGDLANLRRLDLSGNKLNGEIPSELGQLANLEVLRLAGNRLSGEVPSELGDLTNLEAVELSFNRLSGEILSELGRLASLKVLEISFNQLSGEIPAELAQLANLEVLSLYNNQLSGEIPSELGDLASLEWLWLRGNQLSGEIPSELGDLPNLRSLNLSGNQSSGEIPSELGDPVNLEYLDLSGNQLSGEIPSELGNLANLQWLWLGGNQLRGEIPFTLGDLDKLELLEISSNELSGEIPSELGDLANLRSLDLSSNQLSGEIPSELGNLANLQWLRLGGNQLTGCIPEELRDVENNDLDRLGLPLCGDTPGLPPTDPCGQTLTGDGTVSGQWAAGCESEHRDGRHARYYSFALYQESEVTITLESGEADTYLYLREGQARSGDFLHQNDDLEAGNTNSRVTATLEAGDYTVEATTYGAGETGSFTLTVAGLGTAAGPTPSVPALWFDTESPPFDDPRVRFATSYAIDQELINEIFWDGRGDLQSPVPDALFPQWTTELDEPGVLQEWHLYDPGESRRLLAEAGYADGFETRVHVPPRWAQWAEVIAEMLAEVDIAVDVVISDPALVAALGQVSHQSMIVAPLQGFGGDVAAFIREHFTDEGQHNYSRLASDVPEEILSEFVGTEDPERRRELVYNLQNYLHDWWFLVPLPAPPASTDPCIEPLGGLATITGDWDEDACASEVPGRGYARYFSFTVAQASEVTITLESIEADTYLYLREGEARSGGYLYENDDHEGSTEVSQIQETLGAGTYTAEATTYSEGDTGSFTLTIAGLGTTAPPGRAAVDREALIALYNTSDGPTWVNSANWLSDEPLGEWYGVTTDSGGHVTRLDLNTNQLVGEIPPELGGLSNLQWLDFGNGTFSCGAQGCEPTSPSANRLSGEMPAELGDLANLIRLNLSANQLSGEIPSELGRLANLEYLSLTGNQLTGEIPPELGDLASLESLGLSFNQLSGEIPSELGDPANLELLRLSGTQLSGEIPSELGDLANLRSLNLSSNQLSGEIPSALANLARLAYLNLSDNRLSGEILSELGNLSNLGYLELSGNQLSGEIPSELGNLASLRRLWLSDNQLNAEIPSELGNLANLQWLDLRANRLSGEIPAELGQLANLEVLWLSNNRLSGEIPAELGQLANLTGLYLHNNQVSGEIPSELGNLASLAALNLSFNRLNGETPSELGDLANLRLLYLSGNQLSGEIPPALGRLSNLELLHLYNNQLSGEIPTDLGQLANLEVLYIYDNQLSGEIPAGLGQLANLTGLALSNNQLSGEIPPALGQLANLKTLHLHSNQLSGEIPPALGRLANLEVLSLYDNELSGEIPAELGQLASLEQLYLSGNRLTGCVPAGLRDVPRNDFNILGLPFCRG